MTAAAAYSVDTIVYNGKTYNLRQTPQAVRAEIRRIWLKAGLPSVDGAIDYDASVNRLNKAQRVRVGHLVNKYAI